MSFEVEVPKASGDPRWCLVSVPVLDIQQQPDKSNAQQMRRASLDMAPAVTGLPRVGAGRAVSQKQL